MPVESSEDLYGLPLEQFVAERTALAKALRGRKEGAEAKRVAGLKKPTVAAWAVNQLVRTQGKAVKVMFDAGDALAKAQGAGRDGADLLREATRRQRAALDELIGAAEGLLSADGRALAAGALDRVSETLRAATLDPEARSQVESGCLTRELQAGGLLGGLPVSAPAPPKAGANGHETDEDDKRRRAAQQAAHKAEQQAQRQAEREAERTSAELADARRERERLDS